MVCTIGHCVSNKEYENIVDDGAEIHTIKVKCIKKHMYYLL